MRWLLPLLLLSACTRALDTPLDQVSCEALTDEASCLAAGCELGPSCSCPNESVHCVEKGAFIDPPSCSGACALPEPACEALTDPVECTDRSDCYALLTEDEPCNSEGCASHFASCMTGPPTCHPSPTCLDSGGNGSCDDGNTFAFAGCAIGCVATSKCPTE